MAGHPVQGARLLVQASMALVHFCYMQVSSGPCTVAGHPVQGAWLLCRRLFFWYKCVTCVVMHLYLFLEIGLGLGFGPTVWGIGLGLGLWTHLGFEIGSGLGSGALGHLLLRTWGLTAVL